jgi:branched-chain amino acid transport system permease protein
LKLKGDFFILISITVQVLIYDVISNWMSPNYPLGTWENFTNGTYGISGITKPVIFGYKLDARSSIAILSLTCACACGFVVWRLVSSPWGRLLKVIRDDELVARGLGKNVRLAKIQAFAFSCGIASVAGALYASYVQFIDHHAASLDDSILLLSMVIAGGVGNFRGPIVGALIILFTPELLRLLLTHAPIPFVENPEQFIPNIRLVIYGVLLVGLVHLRPQGVAGEYRFE